MKSILFCCSFLFLSTLIYENEGRRHRNVRNLRPNVYSKDYDYKTVALEFDDTCLDGFNYTADEMLQELSEQYPCISVKNIFDNNIFRHHGNIYRGYFDHYESNETNHTSCLDDMTINWLDYCIHDISYDLILQLESICKEDITNGFYYGSTKLSSSWNLDLLDGIIDNKYQRVDVSNDLNNNIDIWVLDSGIFKSHQEFTTNQIINEVSTLSLTAKHGTNVASVAGGQYYGTSKGFKIHDYWACRNTDGSCSFSDIDSGLQTVLKYMKTTGKRSIINLSLGSSGANNYASTQKYYENLFNDINNAGGIIVVAAGNGGVDACTWWFSYSNKVISVGAHDAGKTRSSYSNYGSCVDVYAPGTTIPAANSITDTSMIGLISGTSFASPTVAGLVANLLYENKSLTKEQIVTILQTSSNRYEVGNCPTNSTCYGYYYRCNSASSLTFPSTTTTSTTTTTTTTTTRQPTYKPTIKPTIKPTNKPTNKPTISPTNIPSTKPTNKPTILPTITTTNTVVNNNVNTEENTSNNSCCKSLRADLARSRLARYCESLQIEDCINDRNSNNCYVEPNC